jgi:hypothetical protein
MALILGALLGAVGTWIYITSQGRSASPASTPQSKGQVLDLHSNDIKDELARTGLVVRRKAQAAGQAVADATADARITAAIKAKLLTSRDLSALSISVNTTASIVTLSGTVPSVDAVSKALQLAMDTDGVSQVISTLQVKPKATK